MIYRRKICVHEVRKLGEETFSKKSGLEEIILDRPKPGKAATQQKNIRPMFFLLSKLIAMIFKWLQLL